MGFNKLGGRLLLSLCAALLATFMYGCGFTKFHYSGDGEFTDNGPLEGADRYWLDLGKLDLSTKGTKRVLVGNLPNDELGFYLIFPLPRELATKGPIIWSRFSNVQIRIKICREGSSEVLYDYKGVLYKAGHRDGKYYREGLDPIEGFQDSQKYIGLTIPYDFNDKYWIVGIESPFFKNIKRRIEIEVLEPMKDTNAELGIPPGIGVVADVVISGGGWK